MGSHRATLLPHPVGEERLEGNLDGEIVGGVLHRSRGSARVGLGLHHIEEEGGIMTEPTNVMIGISNVDLGRDRSTCILLDGFHEGVSLGENPFPSIGNFLVDVSDSREMAVHPRNVDSLRRGHDG